LSVHPYKTKDGTHYEVKWREGKRPRSRSFGSKKDAKDFDVQVKARRLRGEPIPRASRDTLAQAYERWKASYAEPRLAPKTLTRYEQAWEPHIKGRHDHHLLVEFVAEPQLFDEILADMRQRGVGNESQRKVLLVMSSVFKMAVRLKKVSENPVRDVPKPRAARQRLPRPFPPLVVERIRFQLRGRSARADHKVLRLADACLVVLMAYAGLRPEEALALTWGNIETKIIVLDKTKTDKPRHVPLAAPLADDLAELREARGNPTEDQLVFPNRNGEQWSKSQYNNWRNRAWKPVMERLASGKKRPQPRLAKAVPRDCRATFVSLHLRARENPLIVARWAGHSPKVMFEHYAHVIDELVGQPELPVEDEITQARQLVQTQRKEALDDLMAKLMEPPMKALAAGTDDIAVAA
jgi:integrase